MITPLLITVSILFFDINGLTNKVRSKETNEQMHSKNIRSGRHSNQGRPDETPILFSSVVMVLALSAQGHWF